MKTSNVGKHQPIPKSDAASTWLRCVKHGLAMGRGYVIHTKTGLPVELGSGKPLRVAESSHAIGATDGDSIFLFRDEAHQLASQVAQEHGTPLRLSAAQIAKRLKASHLLFHVDEARRNTTRCVIAGKRRRVMQMELGFLFDGFSLVVSKKDTQHE